MYCHVTQLLTLNFPLNEWPGCSEFKLILIKVSIVVVDRKTKQTQHDFFKCVF